jgi:selenocysteine lyase/cysteine desulfurase
MKYYNEAYTKHMSGDAQWGFNVKEGEGYKDKAIEYFAQVVGAKASEILNVPNASTGMNIAMSMIPIKKGENVVSTDMAFPMGAALVRKAEERGAESRWLASENGVVDTDAFEKAIDDETKVVYVDQPSWFNGYLFDIKALADLAHDHGAYLVVDATQSIGSIDWQINKTGVDFAATSTYKWLLGGMPSNCTGYLYMRGEHIDKYDPVYVSGGAYSYEQGAVTGIYKEHSFELNEGVNKYAVARSPESTIVAVTNSMKVLLDHGMREIEKQNRKLVKKLIDGLSERGYSLQNHEDADRHCYLNVKVPELKSVVEKLNAENYWCAQRVGGIRVSPHFYNTMEQADRFMNKLDEVVKGL